MSVDPGGPDPDQMYQSPVRKREAARPRADQAPIAGVDTSLNGGGDNKVGVGGIDAPAPAWLDPGIFMPVVSEEEFKSATSNQPTSFTKGQSQVDLGDGSVRGQVAAYARKFLGTPYVWGGNTPGGWDCSGFTKYILGNFGVNLPRVSFQQANHGVRLSNLSEARAGDLIAWDNSSRNNGADHIAIYLGNGMVAEAPRAGVATRIRKLGRKERFWAVKIRYPGEDR
jgi:cell wall-associated NlpC family hydrolase